MKHGLVLSILIIAIISASVVAIAYRSDVEKLRDISDEGLTANSGAKLAMSLRFMPAVIVAPTNETMAEAGTFACKTALVHCYTPDDIARAYSVDKLHAEKITGKGQTIVIVDSYGSPTALQDLQNFSNTFGLPPPDLTIVYPTGTPTFSNSMKGIQAGWAFETSLDLQWAHAIAPDAKLVLIATNPAETEGVQGFPSMFKGEQYAVNHYPGSVISQSFAVTEQSFHSAADIQIAKFDQVYQQAVANNITIISSTGDSGTANIIGGQGASPGKLLSFPTVNWPASDPLVTAAGGTWLQYGWIWNPTVSNATYYNCLNSGANFSTCATPYLNFNTAGGQTEAVWKEDWLPAATGGGLSTLFSTPSFQSSIPQSTLQGHRGLPDISWNAAVDGGVLVYTSFPGVSKGWHIVGGTSASAPQIAGLIALTNQLADQMGKQHVGYLNPILYKLPASDFNDIVPQTFGTGSGIATLISNAQYGTGIAGMPTAAGWDSTTGIGSLNAYNFVHDLANAIP